VEWLDQLYARNDPHLKIVFVPISIRFGTSLETAALPALADRLARALGDAPPDPKSVDLSRIADYLRQKPRDGQRLLVVIDGMDEAAAWKLTEAYLPRDPEGIRIVLSAREKPNDTNGAAWLRQLGLRPECLRQLELLDRAGLADVLREMGFPLDRLSEQVDIIDELFRLTEGDPLLVRLYVDDLWTKGEAAARLRPEDLGRIEPGYKGYFRRGWEDQQKLWGERDLERIAEALLNVLAFARGLLALDDVLELLAAEKVNSRTLRDRLLRDLSRFVIGDAKKVGFSLQHPKLRDYFREELSSKEQKEYEERFLIWGNGILGELGGGRRLAENVPGYLVQYLGRHLQDAKVPLEQMLPLLDERWQKAWERFDGATHANYLHDIRRVAALAREYNREGAEGGKQAPALGTALWCSLIEVSIRSLSANVRPQLLQGLVGKGVWGSTQGLAHVRQVADVRKWADSLSALGQVVPVEYLDGVVAVARQLDDAKFRYESLAGLVERLPPEQQAGVLQEALDAARQIQDAGWRSNMLAKLVKQLPAELALAAFRQIDDASDRSNGLAGLVERLPAEQQVGVLQEALNAARRLDDAKWRWEVLAGLVESLPAEQQAGALQVALAAVPHLDWVGAYKLWQTLDELVERLSAKQQTSVFQEALAATRQIKDDKVRSEGLGWMVGHLPTEQQASVFQEALDTARQVKDGLDKNGLPQLVLWLPAELALDAAHQIEDHWDRSNSLAGLVERFSGRFLNGLQLKTEQPGNLPSVE
jgi:hypothetical protein